MAKFKSPSNSGERDPGWDDGDIGAEDARRREQAAKIPTFEEMYAISPPSTWSGMEAPSLDTIPDPIPIFVRANIGAIASAFIAKHGNYWSPERQADEAYKYTTALAERLKTAGILT